MKGRYFMSTRSFNDFWLKKYPRMSYENAVFLFLYSKKLEKEATSGKRHRPPTMQGRHNPVSHRLGSIDLGF